MKFLVDAQLPVRLAHFLNRAGHQAIHTSDLPNGNASTDAQVVEVADAESRVVITKDRDFRDGHLLSGSPRKLFIVATGNISNDALMKLFEVHLGAAMSALGEADWSSCEQSSWWSIRAVIAGPRSPEQRLPS